MSHDRSPMPTSTTPGGGLRPFLKIAVREARHCVGWRLVYLLTIILVIFFVGAGVLLERVQRAHMVEVMQDLAHGMGSAMVSATHTAMMEDNRPMLDEMIQRMGDSDQVLAVRLIEGTGEIRFSSNKAEVGVIADQNAAPCLGCHEGENISAPRTLEDGLSFYELPQGGSALGLAIPILNTPECTNAACHAHDSSQQVLGILDLELSAITLEHALGEQSHGFRVLASVLGFILISVVGIVAWRIVHRPVHSLLDATRAVAAGDLNCRVPRLSIGEMNELASSFNQMAARLQAAQRGLEEWNRTLEERVEEKTAELKRAQDQMVFTEKMVSLGKLSAVVAHEINNPLAGILVTAKLLRRRIDRLGDGALEGESLVSMDEKLALVERETARCGDIVKNLLLFSRRHEVEAGPEDLREIVDRCLKLVGHRADLLRIHVDVECDEDLPTVLCDGNQVEQACLVLIMNALDAMPDGGELKITIQLIENEHVRVSVRDTGGGIPPEIRHRIFEPFFSTKEEMQGTGLGLAVLYGIIHRHHGHVDFESEPGKGTRFWFELPLDPPPIELDLPRGFGPQHEVIDS